MDLFPAALPAIEPLAEGAVLWRGMGVELAPLWWQDLQSLVAQAPFRHMVTKAGHALSVGMSNCGEQGWVTDRKGYRYQSHDPVSGQPWPPMPPHWRQQAVEWAEKAGFPGFRPQACLINCYEPGAKMGLHQDRDEQDLTAPIVSLSLGLPATFLWGGVFRNDSARKLLLQHGDVVVWGGASRLVFHGIAPVRDGDHPLVGRCRINLTFRQVTA